MIKNEYRRAFIMLRPATQGYGGHIRLERRTLTGSMYFIVTAPQDAGPLEAVLAGRQGGEYYAAPAGPLTRDRRGQLTLAWQFDPRSVAGRPLEAYAWVCVAPAGSDGRPVLIGNVEGSRELDSAALQRAIGALLAPEDEPAADLPRPDEPDPVELTVERVSLPTDAPAPRVAAPDASPRDDIAEEGQSDVKIYTGSRARQAAEAAGRSSRQAQGCEACAGSGVAEASPLPREAAPSSPGEDAPARIEWTPAVLSGENASPAPDPAPAQWEDAGQARREDPAQAPRQGAADAQTAAQRLGLDITAAWPDSVEPLRRLFATQAPMDVPLPDEYTYISAPMPEASGYSECLVGLRAENGSPAGAIYALPAARSPMPPAGLEDYMWMDGEGDRGYWVMEAGNP